MATSKPSGKSASGPAKKARNALADGTSSGGDSFDAERGGANGAIHDGAIAGRMFADGAAAGGPTDGALRDGSARDGSLRNGLASQSTADGAAIRSGDLDALVRKPIKISTVSHTLDAAVADRLRHFAFRERISESAVIEFALRELFSSAREDVELGTRLRKAGAALRRKS